MRAGGRFALVAALTTVGLAGCRAMPSLPEMDDLAAPAVVDMARRPVDLLEPAPADLSPLGLDGAMPPAPDLAMPDLVSGGLDLPFMDLPMMVDLAKPADLAMTVDLATVDLAKPIDLAGADLACAMTCNKPPAASCMGNVSYTYSQNGSCVNGACNYPAMMVNCMYGCYQAACTAMLSFIGNTAAFQTGTGTQVGLFNGTAPSTNSVSAITQTFPHGSAKEVHLVYSLNDPQFKTPVDIKLMPDPNAPMGNNDQWYGIIPKQSAGTKVIWYVRADVYAGNALYDSGNGQNFSYTSQ